MPGENKLDWSVTALSNGSADSSINLVEGQTRASLNDAVRGVMAAEAKERNYQNGSITTGGSANAQTFTSGVTFTVLPTGLVVELLCGFTNTASLTLNMDGIGAATVKDLVGNSLTGGEVVANQYRKFISNGTNWILIGPSNVVQGRSNAIAVPAGYIGEYQESAAGSGSTGTGTWINLQAFSLAAGDWDVWGQALINVTGNVAYLSMSATTITPDTAHLAGFTSADPVYLNLAPRRYNINATTTIYLVGFTNVSVAYSVAYIRARRCS